MLKVIPDPAGNERTEMTAAGVNRNKRAVAVKVFRSLHPYMLFAPENATRGNMPNGTRQLAEQIVERLEWEEGVEGLVLSWNGCGLTSGVFIAVEGIDGAGISTHSETLAHAFKILLAKGSEAARLPKTAWHSAAYTKEPTYGPVGFLLYQIMKGGTNEPLKNPIHMALLFAADRYYHLHHESVNGCRGVAGCIRGQPVPTVVVSDRYKYSSIAYQSVPIIAGDITYGGAPMEWLWLLNSFAPPPHILVYLDVDPETALKRIMGERWTIQLYEEKRFLQAVRDSFEKVIAQLERTPEALVTPAGVNEVLIENITRGAGVSSHLPRPTWLHTVAPCHYPPGRYPHIIRVQTGEDKPFKENVYKTLKTIINILNNSNIVKIFRKR